MALELCETCVYYITEEIEIDEVCYQKSYGNCQRYPPRRIDGINSGFPTVENDSWCGEYKKRILR